MTTTTVAVAAATAHIPPLPHVTPARTLDALLSLLRQIDGQTVRASQEQRNAIARATTTVAELALFNALNTGGP